METRQRSVLDLVISDTVEAIDNIQLQWKFADSDHLMLSWILRIQIMSTSNRVTLSVSAMTMQKGITQLCKRNFHQ